MSILENINWYFIYWMSFDVYINVWFMWFLYVYVWWNWIVCVPVKTVGHWGLTPDQSQSTQLKPLYPNKGLTKLISDWCNPTRQGDNPKDTTNTSQLSQSSQHPQQGPTELQNDLSKRRTGHRTEHQMFFLLVFLKDKFM